MGRTLSPMDEFAWYQAINVKSIGVNNMSGATQLVPVDPHRVALILSCTSATAVVVAPVAGITTADGRGFNLSNAVPPLMMTVRDFGNLVQSEWSVATNSVSSIVVTAIEVRLREWPVGDSDDASIQDFIRSESERIIASITELLQQANRGDFYGTVPG